MKIMYSIHGTIDMIVEGKSEQDCDKKFYNSKKRIERIVTQLDINETFKTIDDQD